MKPIVLFGHERSITQIKYNREGDLLLSCAKDTQPSVWYSLNGERLGTFNGHGGAVWCIDANWDTTQVLTGSADNTCKLWDCETGTQLNEFEMKSAIRTCGFNYSARTMMFSTDRTMGQTCQILLFDTADGSQVKNSKPYMVFDVEGPKVTSAICVGLDNYILSGHENGELRLYDIKARDVVQVVNEHKNSINDLQKGRNDTLIISASKDTTAKLFDATTLNHMKTYKTERPVNSAAISPLRDHVALGGGQEAMDVTTTSTRIGKFDARFFHLVFEEEFGRVKGHFGPINSVAFHPDGKGYSSGGEDGFIRMHNFDAQYFEFETEY
ncbi:eukaryotic translation initiation factor 3 subunit I-like [Antedon mediterranea]|uniref:eukaryotic translation initiation factor 3 subunit I-like n=1 Tax=Antedon mediterranea TaxID=105859 RepID=UPI003AF9ABE3